MSSHRSSSLAGKPNRLLGFVLGGLLAPPASLAQTQLDTVTVTAERSETVLRRTPVSAVVLDTHRIDIQGLTQLSDLAGRAAGVVVPNGFSNQPQAVAIRGVGASQPAMSQAVGIYVDEVPLVRGYGTALWDLPDLARIEVLRGPQGTLHGQNSTAGAVKLVSLDPVRRPEAWGAVQAGNLGAQAVRGYVSSALGDSPLAASLAFSRRRHDGLGYNAVHGERVNRLDTLQWRAKLMWQGDAGAKAVLALDALRDRSDTNTQNFPLNRADAAPRRSFTTAPNGSFERDAGGATLTLSWPLMEGLQLRAISAWRGFEDDPAVVDVGGLEIQRFGLRQRVVQKAWSQELQLRAQAAGLQWQLGLMAQRDEFDFRRFTYLHPLAAPTPQRSEAWSKLQTTDLGIYGHARWRWSEQSSLSMGLRGWSTRQEGSNEFWRTDAQDQRLSQVYSAMGLATRDEGLTPRLVYEWEPSSRHFLYASLAQGAKFGGFNRAAESERSARYPSRPERVATLELGSKSRHLDERLDVSLALFHNAYRDLLATLANTTIDGVLVPEPVLVNAGRARSWGADLELSAQFGSGDRLQLSLELLQSRLDELGTGHGATVVAGRRLPNAPSASLGLTWIRLQPLSDGASLEWMISLQYLRPFYSDLANTRDLATPKQTTVDVGLSYRPKTHRWSLSLLVKNLLDRDVALLRTRIPPLGVDSAYWNPPRTSTLSFRYDL